MSLRSPLGSARGLGAAKSGTHHWWMQRVTAIALLPLMLWLVYGLACMAGADHATVVAWLSQPLTAVGMILLLAAMFYHSQLGLQVVIEDYVHGGAELLLQVIVKFVFAIAAIASLLAIGRIVFTA